MTAHPNQTLFYPASKPHHAPMWRQWRDEHGVKMTSTWIDLPGDRLLPDSLGEDCLRDVSRCDAVVLYEDREERDSKYWTGALVEIGAALALGKVVLAVAHPNTLRRLAVWAKHRHFIAVDNLESAFGFRIIKP